MGSCIPKLLIYDVVLYVDVLFISLMNWLFLYDRNSAVSARCLPKICNVDDRENARKHSMLTQGLGDLACADFAHELPERYPFLWRGCEDNALNRPSLPPNLLPFLHPFLILFFLFLYFIAPPFFPFFFLSFLVIFFLIFGGLLGGPWPPSPPPPGFVPVVNHTYDTAK